ncbi:hypothetical protein LSH36_57g08052 [Paralvinella palmiformis]|uniref:Uncharacterized protein n=1 Tax=Paralvinella palmiformis TaxID=53620 RepID=A0AAD9NCI2_9ANNE|nr:hypothetical protein LSH36_57g08052 [Paralvinella palmiformis]
MFLTTLAVNYGRHADIDADIAISRFNGLFYAFFRSSRIWASLVSSDLVAAPEDVVWNVSYPVNETCGASFCRFPISSANPLIRAPKESEVTILLSVYVGLSLMAIVVKVFFVDDVKPLVADDQHQLTLTETLTSTLNIHCHGCFGLLIPIIYYNGVEQVLILDQFTQAFVTCELGVGYLGYVMITFAAVCTVSSFMMGQLEKCCGRMLLFLTAAIFDLALLILMLKWMPGAGTKDDWLLYFIPGLWAVSDSIWQTTLVSLIAVDFRYNREEAFAAMRFWQIVGITSAFVYGLYVCMRIKLYAALVLLCTSMPLYLVMELYMKHKMNRPYIDLYAPIIE